jgi:hypothetical protein
MAAAIHYVGCWSGIDSQIILELCIKSTHSVQELGQLSQMEARCFRVYAESSDTVADSIHTIRPQQHAAIVPSLALRSSSQGGPVAGVQTPRVSVAGASLRRSGIHFDWCLILVFPLIREMNTFVAVG